MKFLRQFMVILLLSFLGEVLKMFVPLPIPASVYGLVLMLVCLMTGILKTSQIKEAAFFLIEIMPVKTWLCGFKSAAGFDYSCNHSIERFWNQL